MIGPVIVPFTILAQAGTVASGSIDLSAPITQGNITISGDSLQGRNDTDPTLQKYGFRPNGNTSDLVSDINISACGPLIQNKLRFFGSFRDWRIHQNVPVQNAQVVLDQTNITDRTSVV